MRKLSQLSPYILSGAILLAGINFWGCFIGSLEYDLTFDEEEIERIHLGKTTKDEILDWFGPQNAMATKGEKFQFASSSAGSKAEPINNEILFELFSGKRQLANHHSVYFYFTSRTFSVTLSPVMFETSDTSLDINKLWVLVNQESGLVEDYVYRPHKDISSDASDGDKDEY